MNSFNESNLTQLIRQTRNHLWIKSLLLSINASLWISAALLISAGIGHLLFAWPNLYQIGALIVLLPPLASLLFCLFFQQPSMKAAARTADRWLNANSLLLSAWDLIQHPAIDTAATRLVTKQALEQTSSWQSQIKSRLAIGLPRSSALAIIGMLIGATLLSLPGGMRQLQEQSNTQFANAQQSKASNPLADITRSFSQPPKLVPNINAPIKNSNISIAAMDTILQSSANKKESTSTPSKELPTHHASPLTEQLAANQINRDGAVEIATPSQSSSHPQIADKQIQDIAGKSKATESTQQAYKETGALAVSSIQIKRTADADASNNSTNLQGATLADFNLPTEPTAAGGSVVAAEIGKTPRYPGHFNLSQRNFIAQYFQQLHTGAEK